MQSNRMNYLNTHGAFILFLYVPTFQNPRKMYLKAVCGGQQAVPAKLELYADGKSASKRRSLIREVSFTDIERVECNEDRDKIQIVVTMKSGSTSNGIKFNADSVEASRKWLQYCALLLTIPEYPIAECPKENYVTEKMISENSDPHRFNAGVLCVCVCMCVCVYGCVDKET